MADSTIQFLRDLIAINSVNPSLVHEAAGENEIATAIAAKLRAGSVDVKIEQVVPDRANVFGVLEGKQEGRSLMWCGHMDTVGVAGMESPFDPIEKEGRIYGRGSQDMKGGLAAMIGAILELSRNGGLPAGRLILAAVVDEEYASIGAEALVRTWKADAAVVGEPTDMKIAVGHKGFQWVEVMTEGIAAHGSRPADGRDAIVRMGRVLSRSAAHDGIRPNENRNPARARRHELLDGCWNPRRGWYSVCCIRSGRSRTSQRERVRDRRGRHHVPGCSHRVGKGVLLR